MIGTVTHFGSHRHDYLTRQQAATLTGRTIRTIDNYIANGMPTHHILGRMYIYRSELATHARTTHHNQKATRLT